MSVKTMKRDKNDQNRKKRVLAGCWQKSIWKVSVNRMLRFVIIVFAAMVLGSASLLAEDKLLDRVTVPLQVEGNRPYVDVILKRTNGTPRITKFLVDSGGGGFLIAESAARDLGLKWGKTEKEEGLEFGQPTITPEASLGGMKLELNPQRVMVIVGADRVAPSNAPVKAEGLFPGHLLARYHVVFDYPNHTFTLARPGVLKPHGTAMPMPVGRPSGFPRTELVVGGFTNGFLIDTGASFSMVSETLLKSWGSAHPDWPRHPGAFGEAKTLGGQTLETMFVPRGQWGTFELGEFGVTSQRAGTFEKWMSSMMSAPIKGSLAGNVLHQFRVELDYPNQKLYVSKR